MGKKVWAAALMVLLTFPAGCGQDYSAAENTLFIEKSGRVVETGVERLDQIYYSEDELKTFIEEEIASFDEGTVEETGFSVEEGVATLTLTYGNASSYNAFNKRTLYLGTVVKAEAAGYDLSGVNFLSAETGEVVGVEQIREEPDRSVVILAENTVVSVPGKVLYYSVGGELVDKKQVRFSGYTDNDASVRLSYVIYK